MSSINSRDNTLFGIGDRWGGTEAMHHHLVDADDDLGFHVSLGDYDGVGVGVGIQQQQQQQQQQQRQQIPRAYYASSLNVADIGPEGPLRTCFEHSVASTSVSGSEFTTEIRKYRDHAGGGPTGSSVFSAERERMTRASRTSPSLVAAAARELADLAALQDGDGDEEDEDEDEEQGLAIISLQNAASPDIGNPSHHYHTNAEPTETGPGASSATAMALSVSQAMVASSSSSALPASSTLYFDGRAESKNTRRRPPDPTAEAARLPCELAPLTGCTATFPLHFSGAGLDEWIAHHIGGEVDGQGQGQCQGHLGQTFPRATGCWFCDEMFAMTAASYETRGVPEVVYRLRMRHIAAHFLRRDGGGGRNGNGPDHGGESYSSYSGPDLCRRPPDRGLVAHLKEVGRWDEQMEAALRRMYLDDNNDDNDNGNGNDDEEEEEAEEAVVVESLRRDEKGKQKAAAPETPPSEPGTATTTTTTTPSSPPLMKMRSAMDKAPPITINRRPPPTPDPMIIITERRRGTGRRGGPVIIQQQRIDRYG